MHKTLLVGSFATVALVGCVDQPSLGSTAGMSFEEFKARTYREPHSGLYILDWDTPVSGDDELRKVWEATQQGALAVYAENGVDIKWDATQRKNLTYCISNTFGANKQAVVDSMRTAAENGWEKFADVNFVYVSAQDGNCTAANPNVLFDVNPVNANGQYLARAFFPNSPRAERNVLIDNSAFQPGGTGNVPLANIVAHELGHTLGFRHEHIRPEAGGQCVEDNQYRGLTTYDSASVMHYPQCNGTSTNLAFTQRDQQGIVALYGAPVQNPSPMTQVTFPADGATVNPSFAVEASVVDTDLVKAELKIDGTLYGEPITTAPFTFQVTNLAVGPHTLEISAVDAAGQIATKQIAITVASSGGGGGGGGGSGTGEGGGEGEGGFEDQTVYGGCSAAGGSAGLLVLLGLVGITRRRRR